MKTRLILLVAAGMFLLPALAQADIYNRTPLGRTKADWSLRKLIAKKLNTMPAQEVGRGSGKFLPSKVTGYKSMHPGAFGTQISVDFQAQPRMRLKIDGKRRSVYLGGCGGACGVLRPVQGKDRITNISITGLLRSAPPPLRR